MQMLKIVDVQRAISEKLTESGMCPSDMGVDVKKILKREGDSNEQAGSAKRAKGEPPSTPSKTDKDDDNHDVDLDGGAMDVFDDVLAATVKKVFVVVIGHV